MNENRFTIYDLLALSEEEHQRAIEQTFAMAADEDFEIFEANEIVEHPEGNT